MKFGKVVDAEGGRIGEKFHDSLSQGRGSIVVARVSVTMTLAGYG
jgi:hypothetical protein